MDVGIVTAKIDEIGYITHAENLGYSHAWITDSPMIRSNCWAVLALAAHQTRTIRLGTGVNVPGLRLAPAAEYIQAVRGLLRGEEIDYTLSGETHRIRFQMRKHRFIDLEHPIPLDVAGFGPKAQALAGELGAPEELAERVRALERAGLRQI